MAEEGGGALTLYSALVSMTTAALAAPAEVAGEPAEEGVEAAEVAEEAVPPASPRPPRLGAAEVAALPAEEVARVWAEQGSYLESLEARVKELEEGKAKEGSRREALLTCRLTVKEQELQEMAAQIAELKAAQVHFAFYRFTTAPFHHHTTAPGAEHGRPEEHPGGPRGQPGHTEAHQGVRLPEEAGVMTVGFL